MKRKTGDESSLLRSVLGRAQVMLKNYGLKLSYSIDVEDNSYTVDVLPEGLDYVGVLMRLQRYDELQELLKEIVFAEDDTARRIAMQRAGCLLDSGVLRVVE